MKEAAGSHLSPAKLLVKTLEPGAAVNRSHIGSPEAGIASSRV